MMAYFLAVDGGQTTTRALVGTADGRILGSGLGGPANHYHEPGGPERLSAALTVSVERALHSAGVSAEQVRYVFLGMTGAANEARALIQQILPHAMVSADHDSVSALAGASRLQPGVVVIAGTGSVAFGRRADGQSARAGGWGYLMGDEGSAYDIGIQAMRAAAQSEDGRVTASTLEQRIPEALGCSSLESLHNRLYAGQITRDEIAGLARVVAEQAADADQCSLAILTVAGEHLARAAVAVLRRLEALEAGLPVFPTGGVFKAGAPVLGPFTTAVARTARASHVLHPAYPPVVGAFFLALAMGGVLLSERVEQNLAQTLSSVIIPY